MHPTYPTLVNRVALIGGSLLVALLLAGCGSTPKSGNEMTEAQVLEQEDVKKNPPTTFAHPIDRVREAGLRALTAVGCEVQRSESYFLMGKRPNKFGLFVGSGGETVKIFILPSGDAESRVWVDTDLSFMGIAGQQGWNDQVLQSMRDTLSRQN